MDKSNKNADDEYQEYNDEEYNEDRENYADYNDYEENKQDKEDQVENNKSVFISGLPYTATEEEIKELFKDCGRIKYKNLLIIKEN